VRSALLLATALLIGCGAPLPAAAPPPPRLVQTDPAPDLAMGQEELSMEVIELMCSPCAAQIVGRSRQLIGVSQVSMVLATKTLTLRYDPNVIGREALIASVEQIVATIQ
jgi:heavy-metal-associated domain-containing protein